MVELTEDVRDLHHLTGHYRVGPEPGDRHWAQLEALEGLTDDALEQRLYGPKISGDAPRPLPDPTWIHTELRRAGVTLELRNTNIRQQKRARFLP